MVKNPSANEGDTRETWVLSLGLKDRLEREMTTHSSILAWRIPWTEEPGGLQSMGSQESDTTQRLSMNTHKGIVSIPEVGVLSLLKRWMKAVFV